MSKRGSVESTVLLAVVIVALIGLFLALKPVDGQKQGEVAVTVVPGPTGNFGLPSAKEYGGAVRGVGGDAMRAFPGRATDMPAQNCYTCSCIEEGLTAGTQDVAQRVCTDNCGGTIINSEVGPCR